MVHIHDNRRPVFDFAILAMIFMQFVLTGLIAWRMVAPESFVSSNAKKATAEETIRMQTYEEVLGAIVDAETRREGALKKWADIANENDKLSQHLEGQMARASLVAQQRDALGKKLKSKSKDVDELGTKLANRKAELKESQDKVEMLNAELEIDPEEFFYKWRNLLMWLGGLALAGVAALSGFFIGQRRRDEDAYGYGDDSRYSDDDDRRDEDRNEQPENFDEQTADVRIADVTITDDANAVKSASVDSAGAKAGKSGKPNSNKRDSGE